MVTNLLHKRNASRSDFMEESKLIRFYLGKGTDNRGRYIQDIWNFNNEKLEKEHDYIQWLFPLKDRSRYNSLAPVLNDKDIETFRTNLVIKSHLIESLRVMLSFYGLDVMSTMGDLIIIKGRHFDERKKVWLTKNNHNYLRLTRILKSLTLLGLKDYSMRLYIALLDIYNSDDGKYISRDTLNHWTEALIYF